MVASTTGRAPSRCRAASTTTGSESEVWLAATMLPGATVGAVSAVSGAGLVAAAETGSAVMRRRPKTGSRRAAVRLSMVGVRPR